MPDSKAIEVRQDVAAMSEDELKRTFSIAKALALSKRFPDAKTADEAFAKILVGRDLGLSPTQALTGLHIVEGRPQIAAVTLAGFVRKHPHYDYGIKEHTDTVCSIDFYFETDVLLGNSTFTIADAQAAGLVKERSNWVKWPKNMLFARAMSNGVKWFCPDLMGGVPIYTEADVFEGTASELTSGRGNGEPVGWQGISAEMARDLEELLDRAEEAGHHGYSDRATIEQIVNGQTPEFIADFLSMAHDNITTHLATQRGADVVLDLAGMPLDEAVVKTGDALASLPPEEREKRNAALEARRGQLLDLIAAGEGEDPPDEERLDEWQQELAGIVRKLAQEGEA